MVKNSNPLALKKNASFKVWTCFEFDLSIVEFYNICIHIRPTTCLLQASVWCGKKNCPAIVIGKIRPGDCPRLLVSSQGHRCDALLTDDTLDKTGFTFSKVEQCSLMYYNTHQQYRQQHH
ncbi:hypothetical protein T07_939 [Trichinella nelsoni]|uniref:Uncharacterized protein n=1 Tax=Trichinella nelsoni TaxID=6336 RepID=A0A0V0S227_9BILA|nr:hypothetical protein T07_939 [Trichinella nelsoni]